MSGEALAAPRRGGADKWLPLASFATCTFYVFLLAFLTVWVIVPTVILRWDPMVVSSGSMSPLIRVGDIVLVDGHDGHDLDAGTVITYRDASRDGALVTHRIAAANDDGTYTTKGDANRTNDSTPVHPDDIEGVGRLLVPMIGIPLTWLSSNQLVTFLIWTVMTLLAVVIAAKTPEDEDPGHDLDIGELVSASGFKRALQLANLPALLKAAVAPLATHIGRHLGPVALPSPIRTWTPLVLTVAGTATMGGTLGTLAGATTLIAVLGLDPKGPEIPVGRFWRAVRRGMVATRQAVFGDRLRGALRWGPALAGIGIVAILAVSLVPRTEAAFAASTSNTGNTWEAGTWATVPPANMHIPDCRRTGSNIQVDLQWDPVVPRPDGYRLEIASPDRTATWNPVTDTAATLHTMPGLANNVWYYFRVRSVVGETTSDPSNVVGVRIIGMTCEYYPAP
ncbi:MAG: signal peptidase I [Nitriliruptorales bacterium]|nr:signal peptidase I [Nitriliruptorales bacterium]